MGGDSKSPSRNSTLVRPFLRAKSLANSTILGELSTAMTCLARRERSWVKVPSPAPRSAMTMGGSSISRLSASPFQDRPGTYWRPKRPASSSK